MELEKSTILEAIYLASARVNPIDELRKNNPGVPDKKIDYVIYRRGMRGNWGKYRSFLWFSQDQNHSIKFEIINSRKLTFMINYNDKNRYVWLDF